MSDAAAARTLRFRAKMMATNVASFTWPAWNEPGLTISAEQMRQGWAVYYAFTYESKKSKTIVIETYQHLTDNTLIHELLHHYMNKLARDGSMNQEDLVKEYSYHVETLFRTELENEF